MAGSNGYFILQYYASVSIVRKASRKESAGLQFSGCSTSRDISRGPCDISFLAPTGPKLPEKMKGAKHITLECYSAQMARLSTGQPIGHSESGFAHAVLG
jgi:hypothetical protein